LECEIDGRYWAVLEEGLGLLQIAGGIVILLGISTASWTLDRAGRTASAKSGADSV
jgi:hypothetical protein